MRERLWMSRWVLLFSSFLHFHFPIQNLLKQYMQELVGVCKWVGDYYFNLTFSLPFFTLTFQSRFVEAMLGEQVGVCGWVGGYSFDLAFFFLSSLSLSNSKIFTFLSILTIVEVICARASGRLWMSRWVLLCNSLLCLSSPSPAALQQVKAEKKRNVNIVF